MPDLPMQELATWPRSTAETRSILLIGMQRNDFPIQGIRKENAARLEHPRSIITPHRPLGVLGIIRDTVNPFSEEEISFLGLIGRVVAFALDDGLNLRRAQHQNDQLQLLLNLTNRITSNLELRDLLRAVAANIREVIHAEGVTVSLQDAASENSGYSPSISRMEKGSSRKRCSLGQVTAVKKALETLRPVVSHTCDGHEDIVVAEGLRAYCAIPLVNHGRALGILSILRTTEAPFSQEDMNFLSRASGQIAIRH